MAFAAAAEQANPGLLEPIMNVDITVPEQFMGSIIGDLNGRRGQVMGGRADREETGDSGERSALGDAPLFDRSQVDDECARQLHNGSSRTTRVAPDDVAQKVIAETKQEEEE